MLLFESWTHQINKFFPLFAGIYFRIIGYGKCSWTDLLRRDSVTIDGKGERSAIKYSGTEEYLNSTMYIIGSKTGNCSHKTDLISIHSIFLHTIYLLWNEFDLTCYQKLLSNYDSIICRPIIYIAGRIDKLWIFIQSESWATFIVFRRMRQNKI